MKIRNSAFHQTTAPATRTFVGPRVYLRKRTPIGQELSSRGYTRTRHRWSMWSIWSAH